MRAVLDCLKEIRWRGFEAFRILTARSVYTGKKLKYAKRIVWWHDHLLQIATFAIGVAGLVLAYLSFFKKT